MLGFHAKGPATQAVPLAFDDPQNETAKRGERTYQKLIGVVNENALLIAAEG